MRCQNCGYTVLSPVRVAYEQAIKSIPFDGIGLFECYGQDYFPVYGADGGITRQSVFYLVRDNHILPLWVTDDLEQVIMKGIIEFQEKSHEFNPDGGQMGLPD